MSLTIELVEERIIRNYIDCFDSEQQENSNKHKYSCKIQGCELSYEDKSCAIRHIRVIHVDIFEAIKRIKSQKEYTQADNVIELQVIVSVQQIMDACVDLVTTNAFPLRCVDYPAFQVLLNPYRIALGRKGIRLNINRRTLAALIDQRANQIKTKITEEVKHNMVSIMVDIASRYNRSILGVNIAYNINGAVVHRTIGMHALHAAHTGILIRDIIIKNLEEYGLALPNYFAITTDNGQNMIKAIALVDAAYQESKQTDSGEHTIAEDNNISISSDDSIDTDTLDAEFYANVLNSVRHSFSELQYNDLISGILCAAHCFHLIVTKGIASSDDTSEIIAKCRDLVKKLRTPTFRCLIESQKLKQAILDVPTRWNSIYSMVSIFIDCHFFAKYIVIFLQNTWRGYLYLNFCIVS